MTRTNRLSLASFNAHFGRAADGRRFDLSAACARLDADVIGLQEVSGPRNGMTGAGRAAEDLGYAVHELRLSDLIDDDTGGWVEMSSGRRGHWGLAVLSRLPLTSVTSVPLGTADRDPTRHAQVVRLEIGGHAVTVLNTHLTHRPRSTLPQMRTLRRLTAAHGSTTAVLGDLNAPSWVVRRVAGGRAAVRGRSWPGRLPVAQLDHVLLGPGLRVARRGRVVALGSDHRAVRAEVELALPP